MLEPATGAFGRDPEGAEIGGGNSGIRRRGGLGQEFGGPFGRGAVGEFRLAAFAGAVAGTDGGADGGEEFQVLALGLGGARRATENAGGPDAEAKQAVVGGIAVLPGAFHFVRGQLILSDQFHANIVAGGATEKAIRQFGRKTKKRGGRTPAPQG